MSTVPGVVFGSQHRPTAPFRSQGAFCLRISPWFQHLCPLWYIVPVRRTARNLSQRLKDDESLPFSPAVRTEVSWALIGRSYSYLLVMCLFSKEIGNACSRIFI